MTATPTTTSTARPTPPPPASDGPSKAEANTPFRRLRPREPKKLSPRLIVNAVEGFGKTTIGAFAPDPVIFMARGESGYDTLLSAGLVPAVPAEEVSTWSELIGWIGELIKDTQGRKTLVLDAIGGFERLCHEHVCERDFNGDWGECGFASYQRGYEIALVDWLGLLGRLDSLHQKGLAIVLLGHCRVQTFKNPLGVDFDRYVSDTHHKTWGITHKWADAVLFGNFLTIIDGEEKAKRQGKGKAIGGTDRVLYTERRDAFDAKNRTGCLRRSGSLAVRSPRGKPLWNTSHIEKWRYRNDASRKILRHAQRSRHQRS